jgi:hypothetical protein
MLLLILLLLPSSTPRLSLVSRGTVTHHLDVSVLSLAGDSMAVIKIELVWQPIENWHEFVVAGQQPMALETVVTVP